MFELKVKGKGRSAVHPRTGHEGSEGEQRYSTTLSLTSVLDGVGGQRHAPAALLPRILRCPLYRKIVATLQALWCNV
jgi:hypothetical protein